jgi:hypothetical protein
MALIKLCSRIVALGDFEGAAVHGEFPRNRYIAPSYNLIGPLRDPVTLQERTLRNSAVLFAGFKHLDCIIFEEVLNHTATNSALLEGRLLDRLPEVSLE